MSNIPDFVLQVQEVERNLKAQWQIVEGDWRDAVADQYGKDVIEPYCSNFHRYITGENLSGCGVDELLQHMDKFLQEMSALSGTSEDVAFVCAAGPQYNGCVINNKAQEICVEEMPEVKDRGGVVHDQNRDRDYWHPSYDGVKPGELRSDDIKKYFEDKQ